MVQSLTYREWIRENKRRRRRLAMHLVSLISSLTGVLREFLHEIPGTGYTPAELVRSGWGVLEVHRYFDAAMVNVALVMLAMFLSVALAVMEEK